MSYEWQLLTTRTRSFLTVDEHGQPIECDVKCDRVRLKLAANDARASLFHIRLLYGRLENGEFVAAQRDDGIIIGGPDYEALDTNEDGLISDDELLSMSAKILRWDGELKALTEELPGEGLA
jgi:hypothetical protein